MLKEALETTALDTRPASRRAERRPFTDRYLASLKAAPDRYDVLDPSRKGLMVRVTPRGTKTFFFRYKRAGRADRIMIGHYPTVTLRQAYETHADLTKRLHRGEEVRGARSLGIRSTGAANAPAEPQLTVVALAKEFIVLYVYR
jgi:hypothetical protein